MVVAHIATENGGICVTQRINQKQSVIVDYESGRAIPNQQILAKLERALGEQCVIDVG